MNRLDKGSEFGKAVQYYLSLGFSMHWVAMKSWSRGNRVIKEKAPIGRTWGKGLPGRLSERELMDQYFNADSDMELGLAVACGGMSGELEVIDLDTKHWPGIDVLFLSEIKAIFPALYPKLRIHSTVSGGKHILWFNAEHIPEGNAKLAKKAGVKEWGIETRSEGGYIILPPTEGYEVNNNSHIPVLSRAERDGLMMLARILDESVKPVPLRTSKAFTDQSVYEVNPFTAYGYSEEGANILERHGWKLDKEGKVFIHYTRPGKNDGTSATFHKEKRFYRFFTTGSEFENDRNYGAAQVLGILEFGGDYKRVYRYLVDKGYGKYHAGYEKAAIKKMAVERKPVPANFSESAKEEYEKIITEAELRYPHGVFWKYEDESETYSVHREKIKIVARGIGLRLYRGDVVRLGTVPFFRHLQVLDREDIAKQEVHAALRSYIQEEDKDVWDDIAAALDIYIQRSGDHLISCLDKIERDDILRDDHDVAYKVFKNGVLEISRDGFFLEPDFGKYGKYVDERDCVDAVWEWDPDYGSGMYADFLRKAIADDEGWIKKVIGYLSYEFRHESEGYIIMGVEKNQSEHGGGTGKGLCMRLLGVSYAEQEEINKGRKKLWSNVITPDAGVLSQKRELLQSRRGEKIMHINDTDSDVDFKKLKAYATEGGIEKKLYQNERVQGISGMCRFFISTQYYANTFDDGGLARRIRVLTFSGEVFNKNGNTVKKHYGGNLPDIWDSKEWRKYYSYIADSIRLYMQDHELEMRGLEDGVWEKSFDGEFSELGEGIKGWLVQKVEEWAEAGWVDNGVIKEEYSGWCQTVGKVEFPWDGAKQRSKMKKLHSAIRAVAEKAGYEHSNMKLKKVNGLIYRGTVIKSPGNQEGANESDIEVPF